MTGSAGASGTAGSGAGGSGASGTGGSSAGAPDGMDAGAAGGGGGAGTMEAGVDMGSGNVSGMFGTVAITPVMAAYWVGMPSNPAESGGGPFVYLFSAPVACDVLSHGSGWRAQLPAGTQVLELIIGTTMTGVAVPAAAHAAANVVEANYSFAQTTTESRATAGSVTLTAYVAGASLDGTMDVTFPVGSAKGGFHAVYCAAGNEL